MDGTGAASGIFVHVLADPDDATTTIIKFYSDATCLTATGDADLTGVEWTASDATAKCFDVTITDDDSIKSLSVAQDATDNTLFLVTTHSAVQSGSNACDGDAYEAASTTVSACQLIPDYDGDVYVYLGGTVNDKLSF